jgi:hypothetical protein
MAPKMWADFVRWSLARRGGDPRFDQCRVSLFFCPTRHCAPAARDCVSVLKPDFYAFAFCFVVVDFRQVRMEVFLNVSMVSGSC